MCHFGALGKHDRDFQQSMQCPIMPVENRKWTKPFCKVGQDFLGLFVSNKLRDIPCLIAPNGLKH